AFRQRSGGLFRTLVGGNTDPCRPTQHPRSAYPALKNARYPCVAGPGPAAPYCVFSARIHVMQTIPVFTRRLLLAAVCAHSAGSLAHGNAVLEEIIVSAPLGKTASE